MSDIVISLLYVNDNELRSLCAGMATGTLSADDCLQEAYAAALDSKVQAKVAEKDEAEQWLYLRACIRRAVWRAVEADKADQAGYSLSDVFSYSPTVVQELLPYALLGTVPQAADGPRTSGGKGPGDGMDVHSMCMDIRTGWELLDVDKQQLLLRRLTPQSERHDDLPSWSELAGGVESMVPALRARYSRALSLLVRACNGGLEARRADYVGAHAHLVGNGERLPR